MNEMKDGGPAFPIPSHYNEGMFLRDWFAGQALSGIVASGRDRDLEWCCVGVAVACYEMAEAMLRERAKLEVE